MCASSWTLEWGRCLLAVWIALHTLHRNAHVIFPLSSMDVLMMSDLYYFQPLSDVYPISYRSCSLMINIHVLSRTYTECMYCILSPWSTKRNSPSAELLPWLLRFKGMAHVQRLISIQAKLRTSTYWRMKSFSVSYFSIYKFFLFSCLSQTPHITYDLHDFCHYHVLLYTTACYND